MSRNTNRKLQGVMKVVSAVILGVFLFSSSQVSAQMASPVRGAELSGERYSAFEFALRYFDEADDEKTEWALALFSAIRANSPELYEHLVRKNSPALLHDRYRTLLTGYWKDQKSKEQLLLRQMMEEEFEALVQGCPEQTWSSDFAQVASGEESDFQLIRLYQLSSPQCLHQETVRVLSQGLMLDLAVSRETELRKDFYLSTSRSLLRDMSLVNDRLFSSVNSLRFLSAGFEKVHRTEMQPLGENPRELSFHRNSNGLVSLEDSFSFNLEVRWGDCPAGCIFSHSWNVRAAPRRLDSSLFRFELEITESGDPLN